MERYETIFTSNRIRFIRPSEDFANEMINILNNPNVYYYLENNHENISIEEEISWINRHREDWIFSMLELTTNRYIGNCGFNEIIDNVGTIGIFINPSFQNQRLGTEAISALVDFGFNHLHLHEINLVVFSNNERAIHCYRRLGFEEYQRVQNVYNCNNELVEDIYMKLRR